MVLMRKIFYSGHVGVIELASRDYSMKRRKYVLGATTNCLRAPEVRLKMHILQAAYPEISFSQI